MTINSGYPLSAVSLAGFMTASLPKDARPQLRNAYDAIALFSHACMMAVGFRLIGLGEDHRIETSSEATDPQPLPSEWNSSSSYAFRYAHSQSSMEYLVKINRLGSKAVVFGLGLGDDKTTTFDVPVKDYISESSFPFPKSPSSETPPSDSETKESLQAMFISVGRITDLGALFKLNILQKLAPGIQKEGYEDSAHAAAPASRADRNQRPERGAPGPQYDPLREDPFPHPARPHPFDDPLAVNPRRPYYPAGDFPPPGFEDEYEINRPPGAGTGMMGGRHPLNIGENDLYPPGLGPHDPFRPSFGPGGGGLPRGGIGGGGMHPTFDDPLFGGDGGLGGGAYDGRAPPGARYDPIGPGDGPPNLRGGPGPRFPGGGGGMGPPPPNPFGAFGGGGFI